MLNEDVAQINLINWLRHNMPDVEKLTYHVPLQRKCSPQQGRLLKRMGVKAGFSDLFISVARNGKHGLFIELKVGKNKPSKEQIKFMENVTNQGYQAVWSTGWENARDSIIEYFK